MSDAKKIEALTYLTEAATKLARSLALPSAMLDRQAAGDLTCALEALSHAGVKLPLEELESLLGAS